MQQGTALIKSDNIQTMDGSAVLQTWYNSEGLSGMTVCRTCSFSGDRSQQSNKDEIITPQLVVEQRVIMGTSHQKKMLKPEIVHRQSNKEKIISVRIC